MTETAKVKTKELPTDGNAGDTRWEDSVIPEGIARVTVRGIIGHCVTTKVYRLGKTTRVLKDLCSRSPLLQKGNFERAKKRWAYAMKVNDSIAMVVISETEGDDPNCVTKLKKATGEELASVTLERGVKGG